MRNLSEFLVHLLRRGANLNRTYLSVVRDHCLVCEEAISQSPRYLKYRLCPHCRFHYSLTAQERIELLVDRGSFRETNRAIASLHPLSFITRGNYPSRVSEDQTRTGLTEAAVTGRCTIFGSKAMIAVLDFGFMGGSMGSVVGEKVALAFEVSAKNDYPFIALVSGGGVRIQEGVLSLMQMAKTVTAANRLLENRIPFIVVLTNPSTGHAYASFANLADLILAEPGSLIGLAPMKTLKEASRKPIPLDAHTAEAHLNHGLLDSVVDREELRERLGVILDVLNNNRNGSDNRKNDDHKNDNRGQAKKQHLPEPDSSTGVEGPLAITKRLGRPTSLEYIRSVVDDFIELRGDRVSGDDRTVVGGLGYLMGERAVIIGQERQAHDDKGIFHTYPEGLRKARRLIELAARFGLPVVTLIDTQGVHPGLESEEQGVGNAIATTMSLMAQVNTPTVAVTIGQGGSEGALALGIADRVLMQQYAVYTPIPPGQSAGRLYRSTSKQKGDAQDITLTAEDCLELGIIDEIVPEPDGGAHANPTEAARSLQAAIVKHLSQLNKASSKKLLRDRYKKFRNMGEYTKHSKAAMRREVSLLQHIVLKDPKERRSKGDQGEQSSEDEE